MAKLDRPQAHASALLQPELIHRHPLAQAAGGSHQHPGTLAGGHLFSLVVRGVIPYAGAGHLVGQLGGQHIHAHQLVAGAQVHGTHAAGRAAQGPQLLIGEPEVDRHAVARSDQDAVAGQGQPHPGEGIALHQIDGNQAIGANVGEGREAGSLDRAATGEHHQHGVFSKFTHRQQRGDLLLAGDRQHLHDRRALGGPAADRHPVGGHGVNHTPIRKQQQVVVVVAADKQPHRLFTLGLGAGLAAGAAAGGFKFAHRHPLEVAVLGEQHHRAFVGDQIDVFEAAFEVEDLGAAGGVVASADRTELFGDDREYALAIGQDVFVVGNLGD